MDRLWIELTERCNLACEHCFVRPEGSEAEARNREAGTSFFLRLLSEAADAGFRGVEFTGGDVLIRTDFEPIYRHAHSLGLATSLTTNITLLTDRIADLWTSFPPAELRVSIYGWDEASYDSVTRRPGSFGKFVEGIGRLTKRGLRFHALVPAHPTLLENASKVRELARRLGAEGPVFLGWELMLHSRRECGACDRIRALRLSPEEAARQRLKFSGLALHDLGLMRKSQRERPSLDDHLFRCSAAREQLAVDAYGFLQPCRPLRHPDVLFDLKTGSLRAGVEQHMPRVRELRATRPSVRERCGRCILREACMSCPGISWMENGDLEEPSAYHCRIAHQEAYWFGVLPAGARGWD